MRAPRVHDNNFNFIRFVFAFSVILGHSGEFLAAKWKFGTLGYFVEKIGFAGVAVGGFFLLSGYLITQSWQNSPQFLTFLKKRILRIYPGFVVASLISVLIVGAIGAIGAYFTEFRVFKYITSLIVLQYPITPPVFAGQRYPHVNGSLWTITYEFRCYLVVALLGVIGFYKRRVLIIPLLAILLLFFYNENLSNLMHFKGSRIFFADSYQLIRLSCFFGFGSLFYLYRDKLNFNLKWGLICLLPLILFSGNYGTFHFALFTFGGYLLFSFAFASIPSLNRFKSAPDVSYGVYLYGWPVQKLLIQSFPQIGLLSLFCFASIISYALGLLSWKLVEKPFLSLKSKTRVTQQ